MQEMEMDMYMDVGARTGGRKVEEEGSRRSTWVVSKGEPKKLKDIVTEGDRKWRMVL